MAQRMTRQIVLALLSTLLLAALVAPGTALACRAPPTFPVGLMPQDGAVVRPGVTVGVVSHGHGPPAWPLEARLFLEATDGTTEVSLRPGRQVNLTAFLWLMLFEPEAPLEPGHYRLQVEREYGEDPGLREAFEAYSGPIRERSEFDVVPGPLPDPPPAPQDVSWAVVTYEGGVQSSCQDYTQGHALRMRAPEAPDFGSVWVEVLRDGDDGEEAASALLSPSQLPDWAVAPGLPEGEWGQSFETADSVETLELIAHDLYGQTSEATALEADGCIFVGRDLLDESPAEAAVTHTHVDWSDLPACPDSMEDVATTADCSAATGRGRPPGPAFALCFAALAAWTLRRRRAR